MADLQRQAAALGVRYVHQQRLIPLWAELLPVVQLFAAMQSQWLVDAWGRRVMNYAALPVVEQRLGISPRRARRIFADFQVMEVEAREWFAKAQHGQHGLH